MAQTRVGEKAGGDGKALLIGVGALALGLLIVLALILAMLSGFKAWHRYQKRADANNNVRVTAINIRNAQQQARVVKAQNGIVQAKAQQRYLESVGIRRAQDEIAKTLTPLYVQHEAIQAQERIAESGKNNTVIYVPGGTNGVPMVNDVSKGATVGTSQGK